MSAHACAAGMRRWCWRCWSACATRAPDGRLLDAAQQRAALLRELRLFTLEGRVAVRSGRARAARPAFDWRQRRRCVRSALVRALGRRRAATALRWRVSCADHQPRRNAARRRSRAMLRAAAGVRCRRLRSCVTGCSAMPRAAIHRGDRSAVRTAGLAAAAAAGLADRLRGLPRAAGARASAVQMPRTPHRHAR